MTIARLLTGGRPVTRHALANALDMTEDQTFTALAGAEHAGHLEFDDEGRIVGCGLTLTPTDHQVDFSGRSLYTWCAFDTVLYPVLLGERASVRSRCRATGTPIRFATGPDGPAEVWPPSATISLVIPQPAAACRDLRGDFCRFVHFFASPAAAAAGQGMPPVVDLVSVAEAHAVARHMHTHQLGPRNRYAP